MSIALFLYNDFDLEEMLESVQDNIIKLAWHITKENDDLNAILGGLCTQRNEILATLEDTEEKYHTEVIYGYDASDEYAKIYVNTFRKLIPDSYTKEEDILEGMSATWDIDFKNLSFTRKELVTIANLEVSHWKQVRKEMMRMHAEGEL